MTSVAATVGTEYKFRYEFAEAEGTPDAVIVARRSADDAIYVFANW